MPLWPKRRKCVDPLNRLDQSEGKKTYILKYHKISIYICNPETPKCPCSSKAMQMCKNGAHTVDTMFGRYLLVGLGPDNRSAQATPPDQHCVQGTPEVDDFDPKLAASRLDACGPRKQMPLGQQLSIINPSKLYVCSYVRLQIFKRTISTMYSTGPATLTNDTQTQQIPLVCEGSSLQPQHIFLIIWQCKASTSFHPVNWVRGCLQSMTHEERSE